MSIWNKILIGLIILAGAGFFYCAAREMRTQQAWQTAAAKHEKRLKQLRAENARLVDGGEEEGPSLRALQADIHKWMLDRGRVWHKVAVRAVDAKTGKVAIEIETPAPHGIADKTILEAFDEADFEKGGRYLGEFKVTGIAEKRIEMQPTFSMSERELQRLTKSKDKGSWILFELMPVDSAEAFAGLPEEELRAAVPQASVAEYMRDGKPAQDDDPAERKVKGVYHRALRNYEVAFRDAHRRRTELLDAIESAKRDAAQVEKAKVEAEKQLADYKGQIGRLTKDKAEADRQREAVTAHGQRVEESLAQAQKLIEQQMAANRAIASETARLQWEATRRIDQRSSAVAGGTLGK